MNRHLEVDILTTSIVLYCKELLELMPKAGMRELYACCVSKFGPKMVIGRKVVLEMTLTAGEQITAKAKMVAVRCRQ